MAITNLYTDTEMLRSYTRGINASVQLNNLKAEYRQAKEKVHDIIGESTFKSIEDHATTPVQTNTDKWDNALDYLRAVTANFISITYFIFEASERNNTNNNLYRYQEEKILETLLEIAWTAFSDLIVLLDNNPNIFTDYAQTYQYTQRQKLFIKSSEDFAKYYGSVRSAYFYSKAVYLMEEIEEQEIKKRLRLFPDNLPADNDLKWNIGKAIAYLTLSRACIHFDYSELPQPLRNDMIRETNATGKNTKQKGEADVKERLSKVFATGAEPFIHYMEIEAEKLRSVDTEYQFPTDINSEDNKHYLIS